jgi:peptidoglycan/xylan/chitin deacetylase (PgdA/CDA1 family)
MGMTGSGDAAGNRAVSALFRVFGGSERRWVADGFERTKFRAMHAGECLLLGWVVSLTVLAGISEWLVRWSGPWVGWLLVLPVGFVMLNLLAILIPGKKVAVQWWSWLLLLTAWGWWRKDAENHVSWFAWLWLGIFALNAVAHVILLLGSTMRISGWPGMIWRLSLFIGLHLIAFADHWFWGWTWALLCGLAISVIYCLAVLRPRCQWLGPVTDFREGRPPLITIDDGPCPVETPVLLDMLDSHERKAVFFLIGEKVRAHPELTREIVRRGHELGNHTMTHPQATFWCAGPWRTRREIVECQEVIAEATGITPRLFRAPVGHRNLFTHPVTSELGMEVMAWSRRGFDAVEKDPIKVLEKILPVRRGDIVLMHEGTGIAPRVLEGIVGS